MQIFVIILLLLVHITEENTYKVPNLFTGIEKQSNVGKTYITTHNNNNAIKIKNIISFLFILSLFFLYNSYLSDKNSAHSPSS